jgi:hypothetical protein
MLAYVALSAMPATCTTSAEFPVAMAVAVAVAEPGAVAVALGTGAVAVLLGVADGGSVAAGVAVVVRVAVAVTAGVAVAALVGDAKGVAETVRTSLGACDDSRAANPNPSRFGLRNPRLIVVPPEAPATIDETSYSYQWFRAGTRPSATATVPSMAGLLL